MTHKPLFFVALAAAGLALASCADHLVCDFMCTAQMWDDQATLKVDPLNYDAIFGKEWVAGVGVVPDKPAPAGPSTDKPRGHVL